MEFRNCDVVVLGAGTAGSNAAYQMAARGRSVLLLERRRAHDAGARWHNGVLDWQFDAAGVDPPSGAERGASGRPHHIFGPSGRHAASLTSAVVRADMTLLGERLRLLAVGAGVEIVDQVSRIETHYDGDRLVALTADIGSADGGATTLRISAPLFVDASGRRGALRRTSVLAADCPQVGPNELCSATDVEVEITELDGAQEFLGRHQAEPGDTVSWLGRSGGFSTINITVADDLSHASILVGCLGNGRYSTGPAMLSRARREHPWLGATTMGGSGVIPLRRPYSRLTSPGLALVGDAGAQVFPAHGSGIGMGLVAGTMLAEAVCAADDPADPASLWRYQSGFHRRFGGDLLAYDIFRRTSTELGTAGVTTMLDAGLFHPVMAAAALDQRWSQPPPEVTATMAARLARVPRFAARLLPRLARSEVGARLGGRYPEERNEPARLAHERRVERVLGPVPV